MKNNSFHKCINDCHILMASGMAVITPPTPPFSASARIGGVFLMHPFPFFPLFLGQDGYSCCVSLGGGEGGGGGGSGRFVILAFFLSSRVYVCTYFFVLVPRMGRFFFFFFFLDPLLPCSGERPGVVCVFF
jgi:hypothetical protein